MRTHLKRIAPLAVVLVLGLSLGACSSDGGDTEEASAASPTTAAPDEAAESAYCVAAREWAIHEITQSVDDTDPVAFQAYWEAYMDFENTALDTAPDEVRDEWQLKVDAENATINPLFEAYDYDIADLQENGSPDELASLEPPAEVQDAQDAILTYEADVCGAQQPRAADVSFEGEEPGTYCELVAADNERIGEVLTNGADPADVEDLTAALIEAGPAEVEAAPNAIKDEVRAIAAWTAGEQRDVLEAHDFDLIGLIREGPAEDRAQLQLTDEAIRDQYARVAAYEEQVCGG